MAEILSAIGLRNTKVHLSVMSLTDYRHCTPLEARREYLKLSRSIGLRESLNLIHGGQFAVGHLDFSEAVLAELDQFRVLFLRRNVRDTLISFMRWEESTGREPERTARWAGLPDGPEKTLIYLEDLGRHYLDWCKMIAGWAACDRAEQFSFESLVGDRGAAQQYSDLDRVFRLSEVSGPKPEWQAVLPGIIGSETMTWSGARTHSERFWDERVEQVFADLGGLELNRLLGYERPHE